MGVGVGILGLLPPKSVKIVKAKWKDNVWVKLYKEVWSASEENFRRRGQSDLRWLAIHHSVTVFPIGAFFSGHL